MPRPYHLMIGEGEVQALKLTPDKLDKAISWTGGLDVVEIDPLDNSLKFAALNIPTPTGVKRASEGDYIIKDALGNFSVMGEHEFLNTYAPDT